LNSAGCSPERTRVLPWPGPTAPNCWWRAPSSHYLASPDVPAASLVAASLAWRHEPPPHGEAAALLSRELVPLYLHYLDDHIARLRAVGHHRLADRFRRWRARLLP
jgi:hypothetical protein